MAWQRNQKQNQNQYAREIQRTRRATGGLGQIEPEGRLIYREPLVHHQNISASEALKIRLRIIDAVLGIERRETKDNRGNQVVLRGVEDATYVSRLPLHRVCRKVQAAAKGLGETLTRREVQDLAHEAMRVDERQKAYWARAKAKVDAVEENRWYEFD